ncbi:TRPM5 isoform 5 [Pan troglodytes]|uniref:TRPM5 isoform 5 n=1 Tax=Pan troglodytes TaxID=9598 RepID=A0A2J8JV11_PANTR|nr:TRPM5 isoform 5 [Pan troglodytes]
MKSWLRDVLRKGLVKAAQSTGAWILTSALRVGLARHVGQAVRDHSLASTSTKVRVVAVGMASLGRVLHRRILEEAQRISRAVEQAAPWLILAGSGGIADVLAALVNQPHLLVPKVAEKQFKEKFPSEHFSWEDIVRWTKLLQNITSHQQLLTVYDFEQEGSEELDTVILKALVKACKSHSQEPQDYLDELKLAVAWDRVDIAKSEIFNGDVEWKAFLTRIWWGDMAAGTPILRLLGAFLCPALVYTNLITFSEEAPLRTGLEDLQDLDSLDTEKSPLYGLQSRVEELVEAPRAQGDRGPRAVFLLTRWRKFWGAPVTVFLGNVVMYFAFLFLFTYVLLVDFRPPPQGPSGPEVTLYFWVFTLVLEEIRQGFFTDEDTHLVKKFTLYVGDNWNKCDMVAIFLFIVGVTCRMLPSAFEAGRTVLAMDFMVFTLRLIHIFAIHKQLGPKIIVVERMMKDVFFFLFFLSVWLVAYGVTTQALLHPHDGRLEWIFRRVLYRPYLQIFGQIPLDEIDEARVNCSTHPLLLEDSPSCPSLYANWLVILLLVTFLLVTNVLLMNLLIAMFSYTFQVVQGNADMFWKFQRYNLIVEYHERPALAPPFILLSHLSLALRRVFKKEAEHKREHLGEAEHKQEHLERDLPDPLDQKVVTWETVQKENFLSKMEKRRRDSEGEVLRKTAHRVDFVAKYLGGLREQEKRIKCLESQASEPRSSSP